MKAKSGRTVFACTQCGAQSPRWVGRCAECGAWNSLQEDVLVPSPAPSKVGATGGAAHGGVTPLSEVEHRTLPRVFCGSPEFDRVLGGGLVPGSLVLLSGEPGIGKSTLLMQALHGLASRGFKVLYASGEESPEQIRLRAERLGCVSERVLLTAETDVVKLRELALQHRPQVLVVDSIQTAGHPEVASSPGSVSQVRECTHALLELSKGHTLTTLIIGHVTKDGSVAGPKMLEHLVDTVLHLEGDANTGFRILRATKNRFGSTGEMGVFAMQGSGLCDVADPSRYFLEDTRSQREGTAVAVCMEGTRPLLLEIQALVGRSTYSTPRRVVTGLDQSRLHILLAVLEKRAGSQVSLNDIFAGVAGGLRIFEPAADLATATAVLSSLHERPLPPRHAFFGEVGLSGEIRGTTHALARTQEAIKLGFERIYLPARNFRAERDAFVSLVKETGGDAQLFPVEEVRELVALFH
ncbi:MAG: DNA repair protein RadA [Silvanigrellales bacterium]|jgi:DNA repair protein RadA/Sms|nr:DNA repair protein RadA [Silvanigrellales bacterium]